MENPVRVAFCPVLFGANGGQFSSTGLPSFDQVDDDGMSVRGSCSRAWDCGSCSLMAEWVRVLMAQSWNVGWECYDCLKKTRRPDEDSGRERRLPGFYQSGRRSDLTSEDSDYDRDEPKLSGCTRCGHESSFLQLVLRRGGR